MSDLTDKRVFDSIEEINQEFSVDLTVPTDLPKGCNLLCFIKSVNVFSKRNSFIRII